MAKSKRPSSRSIHRNNDVGACFVDVSNVWELGEQGLREVSHRVSGDSIVTVTWEYDTERGNEFFSAKFTSNQLFQAAADAGLLKTTTSGFAKVPRGLGAVKKFIAAAA